MSSRSRLVMLAFALLGLGASVAAVYVHYRILQDPTYTSFCDISATVSCHAVYQSAYGAVAGVPVSLVGALWFLAATGLAVASRPEPAGVKAARSEEKGARTTTAPVPSAIPGYLFVFSTLALAVVLYLAYASWFILEMTCVLCVLTYVAVAGLFLASGAATPVSVTSLPRRLWGDLRRLLRSPVGLATSAAYVVIAIVAIAWFPRADVLAAGAAPASAATIQEDQRTEFERWMDQQPRVPLAIPNDGARVLIVKFNDYQCPPCRQTFMEYSPIIAKYNADHPGSVKFVGKDFPLDPECNQFGQHMAGCEAAAAVRMARAKGRADQMEAWLFENQPQMTPALAKEGAKQIAGVADFDAQYPRVLDLIKSDVALGHQLGIKATPTFFINGVKIEGGLRPQFFDAAIAYELKRTEAKKP